MVKGNWERRVELASQRRQEAKLKKEEKKLKTKTPKVVSPEAACNMLLQRCPDLVAESKIDAWLVNESGIKVCSRYMRTEECTQKKCSYGHNCDSLSLYRNIQPSPIASSSSSPSLSSSAAATAAQEEACFLVPLLDVLPKHRMLVRFIAVDGNRFHAYKNIPHACLIKGDGRFQNIAAASILAKTYRDDLMLRLDKKFPTYQWKSNKGYPTKAHREGIRLVGSCKHHRKSFRLLPEQLPIEF